MYFSVTDVQPVGDYNLILTFENGERRRMDMKPYLEQGLFQELKDPEMFYSVRVSFDTIEWANEADLDPELLYLNSEPISDPEI